MELSLDVVREHVRHHRPFTFMLYNVGLAARTHARYNHAPNSIASAKLSSRMKFNGMRFAKLRSERTLVALLRIPPRRRQEKVEHQVKLLVEPLENDTCNACAVDFIGRKWLASCVHIIMVVGVPAKELIWFI